MLGFTVRKLLIDFKAVKQDTRYERVRKAEDGMISNTT